MHDAIRESIKFDDAVKTKIISFLASNFLTVVGSLEELSACIIFR